MCKKKKATLKSYQGVFNIIIFSKCKCNVMGKKQKHISPIDRKNKRSLWACGSKSKKQTNVIRKTFSFYAIIKKSSFDQINLQFYGFIHKNV